MLIDSVDLQAAVFHAGIPDEMLAGLDTIDLAGIGIWPGDMFKMLGVTHPFVAPADFAGQLVGIQDSALSEQTMLALGATTQNMGHAADITALDADALSTGAINGFQYWRSAEYVTANVNLWPRLTVMFMNGERFTSLTEDQQRILRVTAARIADDQWASLRNADVGPVAELCERGMTLAAATDDDLAALRSAVQPVYDEIANDPANAAWLNQIEALKEEVDAPPATAECPQPTSTAAVEAGGFA